MWREILSRVPVKSILRCRSVCKSWYSLVSCPNFIFQYSVRNLNKNDNRVLLHPCDNRGITFRACTFSSYDVSFRESREHDEVPEAFLGSNVEIVGSCNGLICLSKYEYCDDAEVINFLIRNPTIRKVVELPSLSFCSRAENFSYYGFGFDFKTGDYKVMCMHYVYSDRNNVGEIYDMRKGVWRGISPLVHSWNVGGSSPECYLNGAVHWSSRRNLGSSVRILLSFDMGDEIFREIRMTDCAEFVWNGDDDLPIETRSVTFGGLIHVIVWRCEQSSTAVDMDEDCSVWAMKEYGVAESWTKLFNIDLLSAGVYQGTTPSKFRLWENGEVLMVNDLPEDEYDYYDVDYDWDEHYEFGDREELVLYNTESRKCKPLFSFTKCIKDICLYEESLVLMCDKV